eukprot:CAMPEP_0201528144 /NCGR_PEP_ID=MMETSP0161_2-20130828/37453_1 /ASSEMBLY_ACC=CAM_ASM_000251 /TAXON_ID=180227 /ORGANISM="Neoparamoeba aestuarina, Strain SoJaBio B1-5/56/2" /LENGTH=300 /DNA_ID=CAMNT_0047929303 /DNA_START=160 /DNA_END=1065 /DNA_ORIENTATION=+
MKGREQVFCGRGSVLGETEWERTFWEMGEESVPDGRVCDIDGRGRLLEPNPSRPPLLGIGWDRIGERIGGLSEEREKKRGNGLEKDNLEREAQKEILKHQGVLTRTSPSAILGLNVLLGLVALGGCSGYVPQYEILEVDGTGKAQKRCPFHFRRFSFVCRTGLLGNLRLQKHDEVSEGSEEGRPLGWVLWLCVHHRRRLGFLAATLVPLFDLLVRHAKSFGEFFLEISRGILGMMGIEPLKSANLVRVVDGFAFVDASKLSVTKPSSDLLRGQANLISKDGDSFFFFRADLPFPSFKITF